MKTLARKIQILGIGFMITAFGERDLREPGPDDEQGHGKVLKTDDDGSLSDH